MVGLFLLGSLWFVFFFKEQGFSYVFCRFSAGLKLRTEFRRERESMATLNLGGHNRLAPNMELEMVESDGNPTMLTLLLGAISKKKYLKAFAKQS